MEKLTVQDFERMVKRPGKFAHEARYIPYFYHQDGSDYEQFKYGKSVSCFKVNPEDKAMFPELKQRKVVKLVETNDGFVCEVK